MKKNLFSLLFIAILGFTLIACEENGLDSILGNQETQVLMDHMHNYDKVWASDEESHWHNPLCEDTEEVVAKGLHSWNGGTITTPATENAEGVMTYACVVCGYEKVEELPAIEHVCDFGTELKYNEESHWYESSHPISAKELPLHPLQTGKGHAPYSSSFREGRA